MSHIRPKARKPKDPNPLLDALDRAKASKFGVIVPLTKGSVEDALSYLNKLKALDPSLKALSFKPSPTAPDRELWIIKEPT